MSSPDFSNYINLTVYDLDPYAIYDEAIVYARTSMPEFSPRAGTLEDAIMQASAYNTALISSQINRLPDGLMEGLARLSGLERKEATFATGTALIEVFDNNGAFIAQGTVFQYEVVSDDIVTSYPFETLTDLVIPETQTTGTVAIKALFAGTYPSLLSGQELTLVSPAPAVIAIELNSTLAVGTDTETDTEYFNRATQHFASLSSVLTTKKQIANYIKANYPNVPYFAVFDLTSSSSLLWSALSAPGYMVIVACDVNGANLSTLDKNELIADVENKSVAGLDVAIADFDPVAITVSCSVSLAVGYSSAQVTSAVDELITNSLSYRGYDFSGIIRKNELISKISSVPGVQYVQSITFSSVDSDYSYNEIDAVVSFLRKTNVPNASAEVSVV